MGDPPDFEIGGETAGMWMYLFMGCGGLLLLYGTFVREYMSHGMPFLTALAQSAPNGTGLWFLLGGATVGTVPVCAITYARRMRIADGALTCRSLTEKTSCPIAELARVAYREIPVNRRQVAAFLELSGRDGKWTYAIEPLDWRRADLKGLFQEIKARNPDFVVTRRTEDFLAGRSAGLADPS